MQPATRDVDLPRYYSLSRPELTQQIDPLHLRILEVGCAGGAMGAELLGRGASEVVGLDIFEPALVFARQRLSAAHRVDLDSLADLPYPDRHFNLITFADVLEHLRDPAQVLRHLRRWLRDDGRILVSLPNIRHESVVLPLLIDGQWNYADAGILDRTHLRFFTREGMENMLQSAGFRVSGKMTGTTTPIPAYVAKAAELVEALGGDVSKFLQECNVVQFITFAVPVESGYRAKADAPGRSGAFADPPRYWAGSRQKRVLLVPDLDSAADCWGDVLPRLAAQLGTDPSVTLGIALPAALHTDLPAPIRALSSDLDLDLLLIERPTSSADWNELMRESTILVLTSPRPDLVELAAGAHLPVHDANADAQLRSAVPSKQQPRS